MFLMCRDNSIKDQAVNIKKNTVCNRKELF